MSKDKPKLTLVPNAIPFSEAGKFSCEIMRTFIQHRFDYIASPGDPWLSIYFFPQESTINIRRFKAKAERLLDQSPGFNPVVAFCIDYALRETYNSQIPSISKAIELRNRFENQMNSIPVTVGKVVDFLQSRFELSFKTVSKKNNIQLKRDILDELCSTATSLGMKNYELANLCIFSTLSEAESTMNEHAAEMSRVIKSVSEELDIRNKAIELLFSGFSIR